MLKVISSFAAETCFCHGYSHKNDELHVNLFVTDNLKILICTHSSPFLSPSEGTAQLFYFCLNFRASVVTPQLFAAEASHFLINE
jgi:hypothetical protein